jgi:hypothetical protein
MVKRVEKASKIRSYSSEKKPHHSKHMDEAKDKQLIKKMVKPAALKKD